MSKTIIIISVEEEKGHCPININVQDLFFPLVVL